MTHDFVVEAQMGHIAPVSLGSHRGTKWVVTREDGMRTPLIVHMRHGEIALWPFMRIIETAGISPKTMMRYSCRRKTTLVIASKAETPISSCRSSWTRGHKKELKLQGFFGPGITPIKIMFCLRKRSSGGRL